MTPSASFWNRAPKQLQLRATEIHVWLADLRLGLPQREKLERLLSPDEGVRAAQFHFPEDRQHYAAARGILRSILGQYLELLPEAITFQYSAHGKPELSASYAGSDVQFNLAHSHGRAVYAITLRHAVGVDLERITSDISINEVARRFFAPREVEVLEACPESSRRKAFFECWTRKEAFIKARGLGLALPLDQFEVAFGPATAPALIRAAHDPQAADSWTLWDLPIDELFVGAVAVAAKGMELRGWCYVI